MSTQTDRLDLGMLRFWNRPHREDPTLLAQSLVASGRLHEALRVTEIALERDPTDADLLMIRGRAWLQQGEPDRAQTFFVRAAKQDPAWDEPWRWLGEALLFRGRYDKAADVLDRALELRPDNDEARELRRRVQEAVDLDLDRFMATLEAEAHAVMPTVHDTVVGEIAPVAPPNAWALHLARRKPSRLGRRPYRPPSPMQLFPHTAADAG